MHTHRHYITLQFSNTTISAQLPLQHHTTNTTSPLHHYHLITTTTTTPHHQYNITTIPLPHHYQLLTATTTTQHHCHTTTSFSQLLLHHNITPHHYHFVTTTTTRTSHAQTHPFSSLLRIQQSTGTESLVLSPLMSSLLPLRLSLSHSFSPSSFPSFIHLSLLSLHFQQVVFCDVTYAGWWRPFYIQHELLHDK